MTGDNEPMATPLAGYRIGVTAARKVEEQVQLGRPRRERVRPPAQDEDLQQVETGKK